MRIGFRSKSYRFESWKKLIFGHFKIDVLALVVTPTRILTSLTSLTSFASEVEAKVKILRSGPEVCT